MDDEDDEAQVFGSTSFTPMYTYVYEHPNYIPPPVYTSNSVDEHPVDEQIEMTFRTPDDPEAGTSAQRDDERRPSDFDYTGFSEFMSHQL